MNWDAEQIVRHVRRLTRQARLGAGETFEWARGSEWYATGPESGHYRRFDRCRFQTIGGLLCQVKPALSAGCDAFIGTSIRRCPRGGEVGECGCPKPFDKEHVAAVLAVFADIDVKRNGYPSRKAARAAIEQSPCAPTFIVCTGGGYQPVWVFKTPVRDLARVERLLQAIAEFFDSDPLTDCTRVLRLAGSVNHKHFYGPSGRTAKLV